MTNFKKMVLVDYNGSGLSDSTQQPDVDKLFNVRSKIVNHLSDSIRLIEEALELVEKQLQILIKNRKMKADDKILYISGLLKKHADLTAMKKSEIQKDDENLIDKIKKSRPTTASSSEQAPQQPNNTARNIRSILKTPIKRRPSGDAGPSNAPLIPRRLFSIGNTLTEKSIEDDDEEDESIYSSALPLKELLDVSMRSIKRERRAAKRNYNTPFPSVGRKKLKLAVASARKARRKAYMIKTWDLRPTQARLGKRKDLEEKLKYRKKKK